MRKLLYGLIAFLTIYLIHHLVTLSYSPLPWFDETYFASISKSYQDQKTFIPTVAIHSRGDFESLTYGPVYFFLGAQSFELFGFGVFQFRMINLFFGIMTLFVLFFFLKKYNVSNIQSLFFCAIICLDPFFNNSLHEGRMDLTAIFFGLTSVLLLLDQKNNQFKSNHFFYAASALCSALALLTTPRAAIIIAPLGLVLVIKDLVISENRYFYFMTWVSVLIGVYYIWVDYAFGDILSMIQYYRDLGSKPQLVNNTFLGGNFYIPKHEYLLIGIAAVSLSWIIIQKKFADDILILISAISIVLFYLIILDWGPYSIFIIPFYYLIIFKAIHFYKISFKNIFIYTASLLLIFNFCFVFMKAVNTYAEYKIRSPKIAEEFIKENIPAGSKVVGDALYYYAVTQSGSSFEYFNLFSDHEKREFNHRVKWDYEYLILTKSTANSEAAKIYLQNSEFIKKATLEFAQVREIPFPYFSEMESSGYAASIYLRKRNNINQSPTAYFSGFCNR